jgi:hypothetical protein
VKTCKECKYADWDKTAMGRLHPSGDGKCRYQYKIPQAPKAFYFAGGTPVPCGGFINRKQEFKDHCVYWSHANAYAHVRAEASNVKQIVGLSDSQAEDRKK